MGKEDFNSVFCCGAFGVLMNDNFADERPDDLGRQLTDMNVLIREFHKLADITACLLNFPKLFFK